MALLALASRAQGQVAPPLAEERSPVLARAARALDEGRPFEASRVLAPALAATAGRDPETTMLAARAAARWEGWATVERLLQGQAWLDQRFGADGRALLARARLERSEDAIDDARRAVASARGDDLGPRLITLARAFDRADQLDSAASTYLRAAEQLPAIGDWLRLRAAGVTADSAARAGLYAGISTPAPAARTRWTEALARDRLNEWSEAAALYDGLGATLAAIRLRLRITTGAEQRTALRRQLVALLTPKLSLEDSRDAIALLDGAFPRLGPDEELAVARRAATFDLSRSARAFARVSQARPLSDQDRLTYGSVLQRLGRQAEATAQLDAIKAVELRDQAQYLKARVLLAAGSRARAIALLRSIADGKIRDTATAATAGYLAADLLVDDGNETGARELYLDVAHRFPRTGHGARAAFQAALLAWIHGKRPEAAREFAALSQRAAETTEGVAALYWSGRAAAAAGDSATALAHWRSLLERFPNSYYTVPASQHLGVPAVREPVTVSPPQPDTALTAALDRAALLDQTGLRLEARFEYERLSRQAESVPAALLPTAWAFYQRGQTARAHRLAFRLGDAAPDRLLFPLPSRGAVSAIQAAGADPLLVAALIRQESGFDPAARSRADARGLMQVLPSVGAGLAPELGLRDWDASLLFQPEINVHFGVVQLTLELSRHRLEDALAAYNAGPGPTARWLALPGSTDPEVFIERIQFVETRDYVRRVIRNLAVYRVLYPELR